MFLRQPHRGMLGDFRKDLFSSCCPSRTYQVAKYTVVPSSEWNWDIAGGPLLEEGLAGSRWQVLRWSPRPKLLLVKWCRAYAPEKRTLCLRGQLFCFLYNRNRQVRLMTREAHKMLVTRQDFCRASGNYVVCSGKSSPETHSIKQIHDHLGFSLCRMPKGKHQSFASNWNPESFLWSHAKSASRQVFGQTSGCSGGGKPCNIQGSDWQSNSRAQES